MKPYFGLSQNDGKCPIVFCKHIIHFLGNCSLLFAGREGETNLLIHFPPVPGGSE